MELLSEGRGGVGGHVFSEEGYEGFDFVFFGVWGVVLFGLGSKVVVVGGGGVIVGLSYCNALLRWWDTKCAWVR